LNANQAVGSNSPDFVSLPAPIPFGFSFHRDQPTVLKDKFVSSVHLSDLSAGGQIGQSTGGDYPEMPAFLRRLPPDQSAPDNGRAPALRPPGDSLNDFE
jgi:hypothetical protein